MRNLLNLHLTKQISILQSKIADSITLSIYGSLTLIGSAASLALFLLFECRQKREKCWRSTTTKFYIFICIILNKRKYGLILSDIIYGLFVTVLQNSSLNLKIYVVFKEHFKIIIGKLCHLIRQAGEILLYKDWLRFLVRRVIFCYDTNFNDMMSTL